MYLNKDSLDVEIVSSKSSEMNVMLPTPSGDDYVSSSYRALQEKTTYSLFLQVETPIPEQFKTVISGNSLQTTFVESLG